MALTPEQRRSVVKATLARINKGLPPLVPASPNRGKASDSKPTSPPAAPKLPAR